MDNNDIRDRVSNYTSLADDILNIPHIDSDNMDEYLKNLAEKARILEYMFSMLCHGRGSSKTPRALINLVLCAHDLDKTTIKQALNSLYGTELLGNTQEMASIDDILDITMKNVRETGHI